MKSTNCSYIVLDQYKKTTEILYVKLKSFMDCFKPFLAMDVFF